MHRSTTGAAFGALIFIPVAVFGQARDGHQTTREGRGGQAWPAIVLHLDDHWGMTPYTKKSACAETVRIFSDAGVHVNWVDGVADSQNGVDGLKHFAVVIVDVAGTERMATDERLD